MWIMFRSEARATILRILERANEDQLTRIYLALVSTLWISRFEWSAGGPPRELATISHSTIVEECQVGKIVAKKLAKSLST